MTKLLRLLLVAVAAGTLAASVPAASSAPAARRAVFLAIDGQGRVTSVPRGISCPSVCRAFFGKDALVRLVAHPASGWALAAWSGSCAGRRGSCAFNLTSSHDCSASLCTVGAFGVRVAFTRKPG